MRAATAAGSANPIAAAPLEISTVFGLWVGHSREIHSLWAPTSEISTSSGPISVAQVAQRRAAA